MISNPAYYYSSSDCLTPEAYFYILGADFLNMSIEVTIPDPAAIV